MTDDQRPMTNSSRRLGTRPGPFRDWSLVIGHWSLVIVLLTLGCSRRGTSDQTEEPDGPVWFQDFTAESGLDFVHDAGPAGHYFMPQIMGSGAAFFDYDNDGRLDIYLLQNGGPDSQSRNRLYHQEPDGRFRDVSAGSGLDIAGYNMG